MRKVRKITSEEERFRVERHAGSRLGRIRRDPVEPEPIGTLILLPVRVVGYDQDCDGSLMARLEVVSLDDIDGELDPSFRSMDLNEVQTYAGILTHYGLYPSTGIVATPDEVRALLAASPTGGATP